MVQNDSIPYDPANSNHKFLVVLGLAKFEEAKLVFRNELYKNFAKNSPQFAANPDALNNPSPLIAPLVTSLSFMNSEELKEIAFEMELGAIRAYNTNNYRLALAGFGSALEAVLIDWLSNIDPNNLTTAVNSAKGSRSNPARFNTRYEDENNPHTWSLANLIRVARHTTTLTRVIDPPEGLREWRNQIHPSVAIQHYLPSRELEPEARTASGLLASIKRDLTPP